MELTNERVIDIKIKTEVLVCLTVCLVIAALSTVALFNGMVRMFLTPPLKLDTLFIYGVFIFIVILSLESILTRSSLVLYTVTTFFIISYLFTFLLNSHYSEYFFNIGFSFLVQSVPWLFVTYAVRDYKLLKKYLYISAFVILVSHIASLFLFRRDLFGEQSYQQYYTYVLLPAAVIFIDAVYEKKSFLNIATSIITIFYMVSMGARGPLVCVVLYILLKHVATYRLNTKKAIYSSVLLALLGFCIYIFFYDILAGLLFLLEKLNFSTRIIKLLIEGYFFQDTARVRLFKYSLDILKANPLLGVGLGKDRILLAGKIGSGISEAIGWYPHNIFLEISLHFGIFIGGAVILFLLRVIYISIFRNTDKYAVDSVCIFMGIGFFPLLFSGSYITSPEFFALIGFCLYQYKKVKKPVR